jgi:CobQ-like glutamine amidotransferase family enzyme
MNLYGDHGNVLTLVRRCEWRGISAKVVEYEPGGKLPEKVDIIFGGGGQDSGQGVVAADLGRIGGKIREWVGGGMPCLVICGMYQLFGEYFRTLSGEVLRGISVFDMTTVGGTERLIGNVVVETEQFGRIVGYENHSGQTRLSRFLAPLGRVVRGAGNNGEDGYEGVRRENCIGTYLHGPILPKNPGIADFLILEAMRRKYGAAEIKGLDDALEYGAHEVARGRPR